jgi:hypothetical protein
VEAILASPGSDAHTLTYNAETSIITNFHIDDAEVETLWEHERLGELAGTWTITESTCANYMTAEAFMMKQAAKATLKEDAAQDEQQ